MRGDYAYLSDGGLRIFDVRDPALPFEVGALPFADGSGYLAVWDRYAYLVGGKGLFMADYYESRFPADDWAVGVGLRPAPTRPYPPNKTHAIIAP